MESPRLTYCGNVHPSETLDGWLRATRDFAAPIGRARGEAGHAFGIGAFWPAAVAAELANDPAARARAAEQLRADGLVLWTLNVFPFGGFHDAVVKDAVYRPDWGEPARLRFTLEAARAACALAEEAAVLPLSSLPLGYGTGDLDAMAAQLRACARAFAALEATTGRSPRLALEPEPFCLLETAAATADFLEQRVFLGQRDEELLRRHLGVCLDLCHLAVVGEDPLAALAALRARGIEVPKIQVSSCLELRRPAAGLAPLLAFDEPRYLHQSVGSDGLRALDLGELRARAAEFERCSRVRTHFHLPLFWDAEAALGSTRDEVDRFLRQAPRPLPLLEVETYTWSVLDTSWRPERDLSRGILRELDWVSDRFRDRI